MGQGQPLGSAHGTIRIETQFEQARAASRQFAQEIERIFGSIDNSSNKAQRSLGSLSQAFGQLAGAFGIGIGVAGIAQLGRMAIESEKLATAYARQQVAAVELAGSQAQLNELMVAYDSATGGAIDRATALSDVTRLQAVGFADSAEELERFVRVARGISVATGQQQDYVISQLQLAIANQSTLRLDQLGLGVEEVTQRIDELRQADSGLSQEMAYQIGILGIAEQKFGALVDSTEAQATGTERVSKAWKDLRLELGQELRADIGPAANALADLIQQFDELLDRRRRLNNEMNDLGTIRAREIQIERNQQPFGILTTREQAWIEEAGQRSNQRRISRISGPGADPFTEDREQAIFDWTKARNEIERQANEQSLDEIRTYNRQRAEAEQQYGKTVTREQQDFAISRARQEQQLTNQIAEIRENGAEREQAAARELAENITELREDAARQEARWARDLERNLSSARSQSAKRIAEAEEAHKERIAEARADNAERLAQRQIDLDESLADARAESLSRLADIEQGYQRTREQAARQHQDTILDAASRLDARAVWQEQRRYEREEEERNEAHGEAIAEEQRRLAEFEAKANEAHAKAVSEEQRRLQEFIDEQNKAHGQRLQDEKENLAERVRAEKEAHAQRVADAKEALDRQYEDLMAAHEAQKTENDRAEQERIDDLVKHHEAAKTQEDADRLLRLQRLAADHNDQLTEMDRVHGERITQIADQGQKERDALDDEFDLQMLELGHANAEKQKVQDLWEEASLKSAEDYWKKQKAMIDETPIIGPPTQGDAETPFGGPNFAKRSELQGLITTGKRQVAVMPEGETRTNLENQINQWLADLNALGGPVGLQGLGSASANTSILPQASGAAFAMPQAGVAGMGGALGGGITIGDIHVYGAPGQSEQRLAELVRQEIYYTVKRAASGM